MGKLLAPTYKDDFNPNITNALSPQLMNTVNLLLQLLIIGFIQCSVCVMLKMLKTFGQVTDDTCWYQLQSTSLNNGLTSKCSAFPALHSWLSQSHAFTTSHSHYFSTLADVIQISTEMRDQDTYIKQSFCTKSVSKAQRSVKAWDSFFIIHQEIFWQQETASQYSLKIMLSLCASCSSSSSSWSISPSQLTKKDTIFV